MSETASQQNRNTYSVKTAITILLLSVVTIGAYFGVYLKMMTPVEQLSMSFSSFHSSATTFNIPLYGYQSTKSFGYRATKFIFWPAHWIDHKLRPRLWSHKAQPWPPNLLTE